jgi:DNA-binding response OmpR family regulator
MSRILVIDDNEIVRDTLRLILTGAGHQVALAHDGNAGLKAFDELAPDLVITDILMPEKEGMETISDLRRLAARVPIIAISGGGRVGNMDFLAAARQFGADRTFTKPFEPDQVLAAVSELLEAARAA